MYELRYQQKHVSYTKSAWRGDRTSRQPRHAARSAKAAWRVDRSIPPRRMVNWYPSVPTGWHTSTLRAPSHPSARLSTANREPAWHRLPWYPSVLTGWHTSSLRAPSDPSARLSIANRAPAWHRLPGSLLTQHAARRMKWILNQSKIVLSVWCRSKPQA